MPYDDHNVFARILRGELPCHKVYETEAVLAFMDVMPRSKGHVLVIPKAKVRNLFDVSSNDLNMVMEAVQRIAVASMRTFEADGISIIQSNESAGGQVVFHMHIHVIPRFEGVDLLPHTTKMESPDVLAGYAERLRTALNAG